MINSVTDAEFIEHLAYSYVEPFGDEQRQGAIIASWLAAPHLAENTPATEYFMASKDAWLLKFKEERQLLESMTGEDALAATAKAFNIKGGGESK